MRRNRIDILIDTLPNGFLNKTVFEELLELEEDDRGFLSDVIVTYIEQMINKIKEIKYKIVTKGWIECSELGHLLKGSSGAMGMILISKTCERIEGLGKLDGDDMSYKLRNECELLEVKFKIARDFLLSLIEILSK